MSIHNKPLTIAGVTFQAPLRFAEGHTLNANEAAALNALLHREIAGKVKTKLEKLRSGSPEAPLPLDELQNELAELALNHEFVTKSAHTFDPVQREAFKILRPLVTKALQRKNIDVKTLPDGKFDELMLQALAKRQDIQEEAKRRASALRDMAASAVGMGQE